MSKHNKIGVKGEQIAVVFLLNKGYNILHTNWRSGKKEVDIIVFKDGTVVFVEVKTRTGTRYIFPEEAVDRKKQLLLKAAATAFMDTNKEYINIRFDIISILLDGDNVKEIVHFEEAFH